MKSIKEVPVEKEIEVIKEVPVEKIVEVIKEVIKEVPIELNDNQLLIDLNTSQLALLKFFCNGSRTHKEQNYYAVSPKFTEKYGEILIPLSEGNELHNVKAAMVNAVLLSAINGPGDYIEYHGKKTTLNVINEANAVNSENEDELTEREVD